MIKKLVLEPAKKISIGTGVTTADFLQDMAVFMSIWLSGIFLRKNLNLDFLVNRIKSSRKLVCVVFYQRKRKLGFFQKLNEFFGKED